MSPKTNKRSSRVTASDVAEKARVSKYAVSRALNPKAYIAKEKRAHILEVAKDLGYRPNLLAQNLRTGSKKLKIVALVVDSFDNYNLLSVLDEITSQLRERGYTTILLNIQCDTEYESALFQADQLQISGVIFLGAVLPDHFVHIVKEIKHIPLVVLYRDTDLQGVRVVNTDEVAAAKEIFELFKEQNIKRFLTISGPCSGSTETVRLGAFKELALSDGGISVENIAADSYSSNVGYDVMMAYLNRTPDSERVEGVFCENDNLAFGVIEAIKELKASISVIGFDGTPLAASKIYNLTTYQQPIRLLAKEAIRSIEDSDLSVGKVLAPGKLVIRTSHIINV